ncbi:MarR family transcriptional regulator [Larsenimonas rhizosphaerae]|uniref:MarR family transcriptional regulator n=1 Tax=Larsenimonas rhizosphaerae TaxID=2944682 RepID=A0AA42CXZ5_9GAMM|nr:MarR family transcriptional regulator [Larsenimonas rhizosphaerae]MCM2129838.1 MarR family transcriptional regulator [Larsenimonas rhizosphaerae]MCX2524498.1 MarR family transcriptional regulator [Larsenimonas rhizosphaerae]
MDDLIDQAGRIVAAHGVDALEGLVLALLAERSPQATGTLARRMALEHALVRRSASRLEEAGWIACEPSSGRSPGMRLTLLESP